jgi:hypothetical protein
MNQTKDIITAYLAERGITSFTMYQANGCIGVSYGVRISCYMYIKDDKVVEVIYD